MEVAGRTWECLDLHFPLTASSRPGTSVVLIETEGSQGVLPLEAAWAQSPSFKGLRPRPALCFTHLPAQPLGLRGDPGKHRARESEEGLSQRFELFLMSPASAGTFCASSATWEALD